MLATWGGEWRESWSSLAALPLISWSLVPKNYRPLTTAERGRIGLPQGRVPYLATYYQGSSLKTYTYKQHERTQRAVYILVCIIKEGDKGKLGRDWRRRRKGETLWLYFNLRTN